MNLKLIFKSNAEIFRSVADLINNQIEIVNISQ
jgi:hypothetical protein